MKKRRRAPKIIGDRGQSSRRGLRKSLGLFQLSIYGIGTIIGAGIYSVIAPAAEAAGDAIWITFVLAALVSSFSALSYAEIASALPGAGAEHNFLRSTFPKFPALAFVVGLFIMVHGAATLATVALTFGNYFASFSGWSATLIALVLMTAMTTINIAGLHLASRLNAFLTVLQITCLVIFAVAVLGTGDWGARLAPKLTLPADWFGVLQGTAIIFFIYTGFEHMAALTEEAKRPDRDIWRAFVIALTLTTVVYLLIVFAVLMLVSTDQLARSESPLAFAANAQSSLFGTVILSAALLATANAVLSASVSGSRILFGMARAGDLPGVLTRTLQYQRSPWLSALVFLSVAGLFAAFGDIKIVASLSSLGAILVFIAVNTAVIALRYTQPGLKRPFRVPSLGKFPITAAIGVLVSLVIAGQYDFLVYAIFGGAVGVGIGGYMLAARGR